MAARRPGDPRAPQSGGIGYDYPNVVLLDDQCSVQTLPNLGGANEVDSPSVDGKGGISWLAFSNPAQTIAVLHWDPTTSGTTQIGAISSPDATSFLGDATDVYWSAISNFGAPTATTTITTVATAGGTPRPLATLPGEFMVTDVDDDSIYVLTYPYGGASTLTLTRMSKLDQVDIGGGEAFLRVVPDTWRTTRDVYWAVGARVVRAPKSGGPPEVVLDLNDPSSMIMGIAFDSCNVYAAVQSGSTSLSYSLVGQELCPRAPTMLAPVGFLRLSPISLRCSSSKCQSILPRRALRYGRKP